MAPVVRIELHRSRRAGATRKETTRARVALCALRLTRGPLDGQRGSRSATCGAGLLLSRVRRRHYLQMQRRGSNMILLMVKDHALVADGAFSATESVPV